MKRYELEETDPPGLRLMCENPNGGWVRIEEVAELERGISLNRLDVLRERDCYHAALERIAKDSGEQCEYSESLIQIAREALGLPIPRTVESASAPFDSDYYDIDPRD